MAVHSPVGFCLYSNDGQTILARGIANNYADTIIVQANGLYDDTSGQMVFEYNLTNGIALTVGATTAVYKVGDTFQAAENSEITGINLYLIGIIPTTAYKFKRLYIGAQVANVGIYVFRQVNEQQYLPQKQ